MTKEVKHPEQVAQNFFDKVVAESAGMSDERRKEVILIAVLSAAWHALKSYEYGNSSTELAKGMCEAIEHGAGMLGVTLEGVGSGKAK